MMTVRKEDLRRLVDRIDSEGLEYTLCDYSDWEEIEDKQFHELRLRFEKTRDALARRIKTLCALVDL